MTIRNDATRPRILLKERRRPRSVVARQGQVLLDTDLDQQSRHHLDRIEIETEDTLGPADRLLVPAGTHGFEISPTGNTVNIKDGWGYLSGWLLENANPDSGRQCTLSTQPHPRDPADTMTSPYVVAIKSLVRHIDPVEDPRLADPALGDAQASGRSLIDWQVFPFNLTGGPVSCGEIVSNAQWQKLTEPSSGTLSLRLDTAAASTDPCSLTPMGGYTRLENLCFRFEVHDGVVDPLYPTIDGPHFKADALRIKFSRRNASTMVRISKITNAVLEVEPPALDARNWFAPGQYAEIVSLHDDVDPRAALAHERFFRVAKADNGSVTLEETTTAKVAATGVKDTGEWFLRLWDAFPDGEGLKAIALAGGSAESSEIPIGDGLKIVVGPGKFRRGDYWAAALRADGSADWPGLAMGGIGNFEAPHGPEVRYAPLLTSTGLEDCRLPFATLTDRTLEYRGGDGQTVFAPSGSGAMLALPALVRVAVMRGKNPVSGAIVVWSFAGPAGSSCLIDGAPCDVNHTVSKTTGPDGVSEVRWSIDASQRLSTHQIKATLDDPPPSGTQAIVFTATFETAAHTGYTPGQCAHLSGVDNVQTALDTLCSKIDSDQEEGLRVRGVLINQKPLQNDAEYSASDLAQNLDLTLSGTGSSPLTHGNAADPPAFVVTLDLPYPISDADRKLWSVDPGAAGFTTVVLRGKATWSRAGIQWNAGDATRDWLTNRLFQVLSTLKVPDTLLLVRLTVLGNFIFDDKDRYLDGESYGTKKAGLFNLRPLPTPASDSVSGDGRRGGDFRMWFWLKAVRRFKVSFRVPTTTVQPGGAIRVEVHLAESAPGGGVTLVVTAPNVRFAAGGRVFVEAGNTDGVAEGQLMGTVPVIEGTATALRPTVTATDGEVEMVTQ